MIRPTFDQAKNENKRFGEFEFEYFGGSDVANKLKERQQDLQTLTFIYQTLESQAQNPHPLL